MAYDGRAGRHRVRASTQSIWGTVLRSSDDFGKSWTNPQEAAIRFPSDSGLSLQNIWQITLGRPDEPEVLYCGVEPAALFETHDGGDTWSLVRGLFNHPHRHRWMPGNGGLALHTIVLDPINKKRMYVAVSAGGVYRTDDGGSTWTAQNRGIRASSCRPSTRSSDNVCTRLQFTPIILNASSYKTIGVFIAQTTMRKTDGHCQWRTIGFWFCDGMNPRNPNCVYIVPVESDEFRCPCDGRLRIYRTRNAGSSWELLVRGLPQKGAHETVLRDGMTIDSFDPVGIYFGTRSGKLFSSNDEGRTWQKILDGLPPGSLHKECRCRSVRQFDGCTDDNSKVINCDPIGG